MPLLAAGADTLLACALSPLWFVVCLPSRGTHDAWPRSRQHISLRGCIADAH